MKNKLHNTLLIITLVLFVLLFVQSVYHPISLKSLRGVFNEVKKPELSYKTLADGSYQRDFEEYQQYHFAFREWAIRLYNQYVWTFYHKTYNSWILIGKDDWLYESDFVQDHYESMIYKWFNGDVEGKTREFNKKAENLYKLQEILKKYNTYVFVNIIPGKDVIYPENLPENNWYFNPDGVHAYDLYKRRFDELGVNYVDFVEVFKDKKDKVGYPLFYQTGTHWSNIASVHAFDSIMRYMESISGLNMQNVEIGEQYTGNVREPDDDLEQLFNLIHHIKRDSYYYADTRIIDDSTAIKPKLITIGDSYFWNISYNYNLGGIFREYPYWYYNTTVYFDPYHNSTQDLNFLDEICNADFIMLNYCTVQLYNLANGFVDNALALLYDDDTNAPMSDEIIDIERRIYSDPEWFSSVKEKAYNNYIPIAKQVALDAKYVLNQQKNN